MTTSATHTFHKWRGTLTDRERFNRQMHHQSIDRCFNMEFGYWNENFTAWPMFRDNGIRDNGAADRFLQFDPLAHVSGAMWMHPRFAEETIEVRGATRVIRNAEGLLAEVPLDAHDTIPHFIGSSVTTPEDWRRVKEERFRLDDPVRLIDVEGVRRQHPDDRDYPLAVNAGSLIGKIRDMLTFEGLAYACHDYPDMVEDMVETCCVLIEHALDQLLPHVRFDLASGWEDICYRSGPLVSLDFFRSVLLPRYARIGARLRAHGIDIWYTDCDGDIRPLLPLFLEVGLNTMFPLEVMASGRPGPLLDAYGPTVRILGGVDKLVLAAGPKAIRAYLDELSPYVARGGFIPFCDHRCPPDVSQENYLFYLDLKERMFGMG